MYIQKQDLQKLTLETKVYHPFFGEGKIMKIAEDLLVVSFKGFHKHFIPTGCLGEDNFINELYLNPIKIVELN